MSIEIINNGKGVRKSYLELQMMGDGGWGEGGGLPSKMWTSTQIPEFKFKKWSKFTKTDLQMLSRPHFIGGGVR